MNAPCGLIDREQFFSPARFFGSCDGGSLWSDGRRSIQDDLDNRLRALAGGKLGLAERNCLLEKLIGRPELVRRLAQYLQDEPAAEE